MIVVTEIEAGKIFSCVVCKATSGPATKTNATRWMHYCRAKPDGCKFLGEPLEGETVTCQGCSGSPRVHQAFGCEIHGKCVYLVKMGQATEPPVANCRSCPDYRLQETDQ